MITFVKKIKTDYLFLENQKTDYEIKGLNEIPVFQNFDFDKIPSFQLVDAGMPHAFKLLKIKNRDFDIEREIDMTSQILSKLTNTIVKDGYRITCNEFSHALTIDEGLYSVQINNKFSQVFCLKDVSEEFVKIEYQIEISNYATEHGNIQLTFPSGNAYIDWGDANIDNLTSGTTKTHTYNSNGIYNVTVYTQKNTTSFICNDSFITGSLNNINNLTNLTDPSKTITSK